MDTNAPKEPVSENPIKEVPSTKPETPTVLNVEELPMFPACRGLSRSEQLKCFEEQMSKAVAKNAEYPEIDRENGKQGRALISFIIDENGKFINVAQEWLTREAERTMQSTHKDKMRVFEKDINPFLVFM